MDTHKFAKFHFKLQDGSPLVLTYWLQPNSLLPKWESIIQRRYGDPIELKISNKGIDDLPELMNTINAIIVDINQFYDNPLPLFDSVKEIDREILNHLHEEFENYGARHAVETYKDPTVNPDVWPGTHFKVEFHQLWLDLNQYIHIIETAMGSDYWPQYSCLVQYLPFEWGIAIEEQDRLFLDSNFEWGQLYLGYNTLGKDWKDASGDNDQRLITNDQVKIQQSLSSEVWLNFSSDPLFHKKMEFEFWMWYQGLDQELKNKVPVDSLNKLAIGRYYLGTILFDKTFTDYHDVYEDWTTPNSEVRKQWNLEVFSKITEAVNIEIVEGQLSDFITVHKKKYGTNTEKLFKRIFKQPMVS